MKLKAGDVIGIIGLGLAFGFAYLLLFSQSVDGLERGTRESLLLRASGITSFAAVSYLWVHASKTIPLRKLLHKMAWVSSLSVALPAVCISSFFATIPIPVLLLSWIAAGIGLSAVIPLWASFLAETKYRNSSPFATAALLLSGFWYALTAELQGVAIPIAALVAITTSLVLHRIYLRQQNRTEEVSVNESRLRFEFSSRTALSIGSVGMFAGFFLHNTLAYPQQLPSNSIIAIGMITGCLACGVFIRAQKDGLISFVTVQRVTFPIFVVAPIALLVPDGGIRLLTAIVALSAIFLYGAAHVAVLAMTAARFHVNPVYHFARGRGPLAIGLALGWTLGALLCFSQPGQATSENVYLAGVIALACALAISAAVAPFGSDLGCLKRIIIAEEEPKETGAWKKACKTISQTHSLSPREEEVLLLLSKGYSITRIKNELFISESTVKSHAYRIYKKIGIGKKQDLIDLVERMVEQDRNTPKPHDVEIV